MRALIVEQDGVLSDAWCKVLVDAGHSVVAVATAEMARKYLLTRPFDIVTLDLILGDESGLSVAALATYANPACRVVVVTGSTLFARGEIFTMAPNVAAVLRKPVSVFELLAVLEYEARGRAPPELRRVTA